MKQTLLTALCAMLCAPAFAADDYPLAPVNPTAVLSDDFNIVTLTWECPGEVGESGGHIDTSLLTYYIFDAFGLWYDPAIATTTETTYTFDYSDLGKQDFMGYQLTAGIGEMYSLPVNSNIVCVGTPQPLPFVEKLEGGKFAYVWCIDPASGYRVDFKIDKTDSQDGDGSCMLFESTSADEEYGITTIKIALGEAVSPTLKGYMKCVDSDIDVMVSADGGEMAKVATFQPDGNDWCEFSVPLEAYLGSKYVQVEIWGRFATSTATLKLDNISITDEEREGIATITIDTQDSTYYTIDGRRATPNRPGIYINGNRKVAVKSEK